MTGDDLITLVTQAATTGQAHEIARAAPARALAEAADLLYIDTTGHARSFAVKAVVKVARS